MTDSRERPFRQKTIGILGGSSNEATVEYYQGLNARLNAAYGGWDNAEIVIVSVNFGNIEAFLREDRWDELAAYLAAKIDKLEAAGVDLVVCVSNTLHRAVAPIMEGRRTPFLHIADPTGAAVRAAGLKRVGLLGTGATMRSPLLAERFRLKFGFKTIAPDEADMDIVDRIIFDELVRRRLRPESKAEYIRVVEALRARGAEGVILGCTEIFLLIGQRDLPGFPVFDTTALHVAAIADRVLAD
ncbi:MAG TPA: amino acid racemase [Rhodoblastus sp.]|mgnify:CR=1 FL=1|nr:amino acid racemase [Rhodoblastus sp.]